MIKQESGGNCSREKGALKNASPAHICVRVAQRLYCSDMFSLPIALDCIGGARREATRSFFLLLAICLWLLAYSIHKCISRERMDRELERSGTVATREAKKSLLSQPQHLHYMMLRGAGGKQRFLHHHQSQFSSLRPREDVLRNVRSEINNFYKLPSIILHIIRQHVIAICFGNISLKKHQIHGYQSEIIRTSFVINSPGDIS